jgi:hypothetical protein
MARFLSQLGLHDDAAAPRAGQWRVVAGLAHGAARRRTAGPSFGRGATCRQRHGRHLGWSGGSHLSRVVAEKRGGLIGEGRRR